MLLFLVLIDACYERTHCMIKMNFFNLNNSLRKYVAFSGDFVPYDWFFSCNLSPYQGKLIALNKFFGQWDSVSDKLAPTKQFPQKMLLLHKTNFCCNLESAGKCKSSLSAAFFKVMWNKSCFFSVCQSIFPKMVKWIWRTRCSLSVYCKK